METMVKILMLCDMIMAGVLCLIAPEWLFAYGAGPYAVAFIICFGSALLCYWILENWF